MQRTPSLIRESFNVSCRWPLSAARWLVVALGIMPAAAVAQTDYYNTDAGRPIQFEDAYSTERYAFELQLAPLRLERTRGGIYRWGLEPELTYGILPRTHLEIGTPLAYTDLGAGPRRGGLAGIDISALHTLNVETSSLPAFGVLGEVLLPVGNLAADKAYPALKGIATRTYHGARFHVNAQYTFGAAPAAGGAPVPEDVGATVIGPGAVELSRWLAGVAVDRTFPLRSLLITGDVYAHQPIHSAEDVEWNAGAGVRYQLSPQLALDAGAGKRVTGNDRSWFFTFGLARAFAVRALMPGK